VLTNEYSNGRRRILGNFFVDVLAEIFLIVKGLGVVVPLMRSGVVVNFIMIRSGVEDLIIFFLLLKCFV